MMDAEYTDELKSIDDGVVTAAADNDDDNNTNDVGDQIEDMSLLQLSIGSDNSSIDNSINDGAELELPIRDGDADVASTATSSSNIEQFHPNTTRELKGLLEMAKGAGLTPDHAVKKTRRLTMDGRRRPQSEPPPNKLMLQTRSSTAAAAATNAAGLLSENAQKREKRVDSDTACIDDVQLEDIDDDSKERGPYRQHQQSGNDEDSFDEDEDLEKALAESTARDADWANKSSQPTAMGRRMSVSRRVSTPKRVKRIQRAPKEPTRIQPDKDMFCWRCHHATVEVVCERCPRAYHFKCLKQSVPDVKHWTCPECVTVAKAEDEQTRSRAMKEMSLDHLCTLLKYAVRRMVDCVDCEPFMSPVSETKFPEYTKYIIKPMDLSLLEKNVRNQLYSSTQAFEADAKWILHNSTVFNSYQSRLTNTAKLLVRVCKQEMSEIENCPSCYLNANTKKETWFVEVCPRPHLLVWAKLKGFPYWPAKVMSTTATGMVDVRFFGAHDRSWVHVKDCMLYCLKDPNNTKQKRHDIVECIKELDLYVDNLKKIYGRVAFAAYKTPLLPNNYKRHIRQLLPSYKFNAPKERVLTPVPSPPPVSPDADGGKHYVAELTEDTNQSRSRDGKRKSLIKIKIMQRSNIKRKLELESDIPKKVICKEQCKEASGEDDNSSTASISEPSAPTKPAETDPVDHTVDDTPKPEDSQIEHSDGTPITDQAPIIPTTKASPPKDLICKDDKIVCKESTSAASSQAENCSSNESIQLPVDKVKESVDELLQLKEVCLIRNGKEIKKRTSGNNDLISKTLPTPIDPLVTIKVEKDDVNDVVPIRDAENELQNERQYMEAKRQYLSALNISEKSHGAMRTIEPKNNAIRTRSTKVKNTSSTQHRAVSTIATPITSATITLSTSATPTVNHQTASITATNHAIRRVISTNDIPKIREKYLNAQVNNRQNDVFIKTMTTIRTVPQHMNQQQQQQQRHKARKSFPTPNYSNQVTLIKKITPKIPVHARKLITTPSIRHIPQMTTSANELKAVTTVSATSNSLSSLSVATVTTSAVATTPLMPQHANVVLLNTLGSPALTSVPTATPLLTANTLEHLVPIKTYSTQQPIIDVKKSTALDKSSSGVLMTSTLVNSPTTAVASQQEQDDVSILREILPESVSRGINEILSQQSQHPPKLKAKPHPIALSSVFEDHNIASGNGTAPPNSSLNCGTPTVMSKSTQQAGPSGGNPPSHGLGSNGPLSQRLLQASQKMSDYFCSVLLEVIDEFAKNNSAEAMNMKLRMEMEEQNARHGLELMEMRHNITLVLKEVQRSIVEEKERIMNETRANCEIEMLQRVEEAKTKQWCANCLKEAQFYCCWNTSYCDYSCQQKHWNKHMNKCNQQHQLQAQSQQHSSNLTMAANTSTHLLTATSSNNSTPPLISSPTCQASSHSSGTGSSVSANSNSTTVNSLNVNSLSSVNAASHNSAQLILANTSKFANLYPNKPKVYVKRANNQMKGSAGGSGQHITLVESTPGNFELLGNGPISVNGKILASSAILEKMKSSGVVTVTSSASNKVTNSSINMMAVSDNSSMGATNSKGAAPFNAKLPMRKFTGMQSSTQSMNTRS